MAALQDQITHAHAVTAVIVESVPDAAWNNATPCRQWPVRGLLNHITGGYGQFAAALRGMPAPGGFEDDWLGEDPLAAYRAAAAEVQAAWQLPGILKRPVALSVGRVPGRMGALIHLTEVVVHGIDLAVAIGREDLVDQAPAAELLALMGESGAMDQFRQPGIFEPELAAAADDAAHRRLMAFLGRPAPRPQRGMLVAARPDA